jgi:hypothetical protein
VLYRRKTFLAASWTINTIKFLFLQEHNLISAEVILTKDNYYADQGIWFQGLPLFSNPMEHSPSSEANSQSLSYSRNSLPFMDFEDSSPSSHMCAILYQES